MQLRFHSKLKIIIPFLILILVLVLITSQSKQNIPQTNETPPLKNPTPDNIQILGVEEANTQIAAESKEKKPISFETQALYRLINSYRTENDLNKLFVDRTLEDSANRKLSDMITKEYFRHADSNNNESWYLFQAAGYQYKFAGENLSFGNNTPWQVFEAWQKSPEHNAQLLKSEYLDMGLAVNCDAYKVGTTHSCIVVLHIGAR